MEKYDNDNFWVHIHEASKSKMTLHGTPTFNLIISVISDDKEAIDLTRVALTQWFTERGLK